MNNVRSVTLSYTFFQTDMDDDDDDDDDDDEEEEEVQAAWLVQMYFLDRNGDGRYHNVLQQK